MKLHSDLCLCDLCRLTEYRAALMEIRAESTGARDVCHPVLEKIRDICTTALGWGAAEVAE
jgi:hypothetical protein